MSADPDMIDLTLRMYYMNSPGDQIRIADTIHVHIGWQCPIPALRDMEVEFQD